MFAVSTGDTLTELVDGGDLVGDALELDLVDLLGDNTGVNSGCADPGGGGPAETGWVGGDWVGRVGQLEGGRGWGGVVCKGGRVSGGAGGTRDIGLGEGCRGRGCGWETWG